MSRDAIAEVLGQLDYGDGPDDVDWRDRLREVDGLLAAGVVVDVDELVISGGQDLWHDLRRTLHPLGWRVVVSWSADELTLAWAPPGTSVAQVDASLAPYVTAEGYGDGTASVVWYPALPAEWEPTSGTQYDLHMEPTAAALLTWLGAA